MGVLSSKDSLMIGSTKVEDAYKAWVPLAGSNYKVWNTGKCQEIIAEKGGCESNEFFDDQTGAHIDCKKQCKERKRSRRKVGRFIVSNVPSPVSSPQIQKKSSRRFIVEPEASEALIRKVIQDERKEAELARKQAELAQLRFPNPLQEYMFEAIVRVEQEVYEHQFANMIKYKRSFINMITQSPKNLQSFQFAVNRDGSFIACLPNDCPTSAGRGGNWTEWFDISYFSSNGSAQFLLGGANVPHSLVPLYKEYITILKEERVPIVTRNNLRRIDNINTLLAGQLSFMVYYFLRQHQPEYKFNLSFSD